MFRLTVAALVTFLCCSPILAAQQSTPEEEQNNILTKRIVVSANRMPDRDGAPADKVPADTTIITRQDIEQSTSTTVQELLLEKAGIIFFDNVGNGVQASIGLRGFSDGKAVAVYLDGIRINEPDNNAANLEFIDLASIERIEILPGSASYNRGGGALAGSVNIILKQPESGGQSMAAFGYGSFGTNETSAETGIVDGAHAIRITGSMLTSDGFRENGEVDRKNGRLQYSWRGERMTIRSSASFYDGYMGNPGALTADELEMDREQNPYNSVDFSDARETLVNASIDYAPNDEHRISALGYYRSSTMEVLTTGRSAAIFGGFTSTTESDSYGFTVQTNSNIALASMPLEIVLGLDTIQDDFSNVASFTTALGEPTWDANDRNTGQNTLAVYAGANLEVSQRITLNLASRYDSVEMNFDDLFDGRTDTTEYDEVTSSFGLTARASDNVSLYGRFSQAFQTPTVNDLFAFPLFGSNPDLLPVYGDTWEAGAVVSFGNQLLLRASAFRMDLENEIVFVITDPIWFIGSNENTGESRRSGFELNASGNAGRVLSFQAGYAYSNTENLSLAEEAGMADLQIPLVPKHKFSLVARANLGDITCSWTTVYVGEQVLSSDLYNAGDMLESYSISNVKIEYEQPTWGASLKIRNIFDEEYSTRGIYSYGASYYTPAAGMSSLATIFLRF